jgi:group I intron endonuclease
MSTTNKLKIWEEKNSIELEKNCLKNNAIEQNFFIKNTNKNLTTNPCNDTGKISGIYKIVNKVNGKYYVGSSNDVFGKFGRWYEHRKNLIKNCHTNKKLQNAWNKHGEHNFEFLFIESVNTDDLLLVEQIYLDLLREDHLSNKDTHYNLTYDASAPMRGKIPWNKGKKGLQISNNKGRKLSIETKKKISESTRLSMSNLFTKMSSIRKGKSLSESHKKALSDPTIYNFKNLITGEHFYGTRFEFRKKYDINKACLWALIVGKYKQTHGWILNK